MLVTVVKSIIEIFLPLPLLWLALLVFAIWLHRQKLIRPAYVAGIIWLALTATTCFPLGDRFLAHTEQPWRKINEQWDSLPKADAVVQLGGGIMPTVREIVGVNVQENSDRATTAIELMRRHRAPVLVIGGGAPIDQRTEAQAVAEWIESWNLTTAPVWPLGNCADTHDEAVRVAVLAQRHGWKRILLVTSASHMTRASTVFRKTTGLEVVPVPCAFMTKKNVTEWCRLPDPAQMQFFGTWFHEVVGWYAYKVRGWI